MCFEGASLVLEPRPWNQGGRAQVLLRLWSFRPRLPQNSRLQSTTDERAQLTPQGVTAQPSERTEGRVNPMSGSGPSVSARPEGEQTVEGVRNPEDGRLRVRQTRGIRSLRRCRCRGGKPQEGRPGQAWPGRASGPEPCEGDEACGSCRAVFGPHGRPDGGMPRGRGNDVEVAANQSCRYAGRSASRGRRTLRGSSAGR
jgi:hypothetical protein